MVLGLDRFAYCVSGRLDTGQHVPLIALRVPGAHEASFARTIHGIVRAEDLCTRSAGTGRFAIALLALSRTGRAPQSSHAQAALSRIATAASPHAGRPLQADLRTVRSRNDLALLWRVMDPDLLAMAQPPWVPASFGDRHTPIATIGHELRTPLTAIRGFVETVLEGGCDPAMQRRFLQTVAREALRMGRMVDGMLEFSLLDPSPRRGDEECDVAQQVRAAIEVAAPLATRRRSRLQADVQGNARARVDGDACMHAVLNLIENAVKYAGERATIAVSCTSDRQFVYVRVDDDGPGITNVEDGLIFALGLRGTAASDAAAKKPRGAGIGLAIVKAVAQRAGGDVCAAASPLGGARFEMRLRAN